jgi:CheY-like chemotaxis protein
MMGGRIWVESEPGQGSVFHFTASFGISRQEAPPPTEPVDRSNDSVLKGISVLIVDDNETNRKILGEVLNRWGMCTVLAEDAAAALDTLQARKSQGSSFPLILLDAQMPGVDGFALARKIKQDPDLTASAIMMLSSSDLHEDARRCRELGIASYLVKPINQVELRQAILKTLGATAHPDLVSLAPAIGPGPDHPGPGQPVQVLLAEDNVVYQKLMTHILKKKGYVVTLASDGLQALGAYQRQPFDLVLMDVQMPEMGGFEVTRIIRELEAPAGRHVPVIALTAHAMKGDRERCLEAGMDDYLSKPIQAAALFETMDRLLHVPVVQ